MNNTFTSSEHYHVPQTWIPYPWGVCPCQRVKRYCPYCGRLVSYTGLSADWTTTCGCADVKWPEQVPVYAN